VVWAQRCACSHTKRTWSARPHVADPVLALKGERRTPPTERQTHGTGVRDRTPLGDPPLQHKGFHYLTQYRLSRAERGCGVRQFDVRMTTQEEEHSGLKGRHRLMAGLRTPCRPRNEETSRSKSFGSTVITTPYFPSVYRSWHGWIKTNFYWPKSLKKKECIIPS
jgi:hypothetical protein